MVFALPTWQPTQWLLRILVCVGLLLGISGFAPVAAAESQAAADDPAHAEKMAKGLEIFKKQVRSILLESCVSCHGKDSVENEFNLATRDGLLKGGAKGPALILRKDKLIAFDSAKQSRLYRMVAHLEKPEMPKDEDKLSDEKIAAIGAWIDLGAPYDAPLIDAPVDADAWTGKVLDDKARDFWSFRKLQRVVPPHVHDGAAEFSPIDAFINARLAEKKLQPNPPADRRQLIRRASFDLTGLPPTPEQVEEFANDSSPDALPRLIDRLLASSHYGERWGRHWLDLARFAESHGFEHDYDRESAYHYRDFVIQALNQDLPYDTFVKWQLAGDEFAPENNLAMMATGFLAAGVHSTQITANEVEKHRYDELDDMVHTTSTAMLGLTVGCARCHDHKFDPIPAADYYRMISAFTTTVRSEVELNFDKENFVQQKSEFDRQHAPIAAALARYEAEQLPARFAQWDQQRKSADLPRWIVLDFAEIMSAGGATFKKLADGSMLVEGANAASDTYTLVAPTTLTGIRAIRLEALPDPSLPKNGPGRAENGNFALSDVRLTAQNKSSSAEAIAITLSNPRATFEQKGLEVAAVVDADQKSAWAIDGKIGATSIMAVNTASDVGDEKGTTLTFALKFDRNTKHNLGRFRISVLCNFAGSLSNDEIAATSLDAESAPMSVIESLRLPAANRTADQSAELLKWYRYRDPQWRDLNQQVENNLKREPKPNLVKVLVSGEGLKPLRLHSQGADFFEQTFFLRRGDTNQKSGIASSGYLQVLMTAPEKDKHWNVAPPQGSKASFRRTALAEWITDPQDGAGHLLARVIVNRLWQHHLGHGIVATPSDFGARGEPPTHPELLDWLASELIRHNWQLKPIHKLIMSSAAYQRSSAPDTAKAAVDSENKLFWRQERRRLEGEVIRDALLAVGDRLDSRMLGPGTLDAAQRRRSIYFTVKRSQLMPMMQVFDAPEALSGVGERSSTTIAPQALMLMNDMHVRESALEFARRVHRATADANSRINQAYLVAIGRQPDATETSDAADFIAQQHDSYKTSGKPNADELALADFCQVLLCLNEFVYVE